MAANNVNLSPNDGKAYINLCKLIEDSHMIKIDYPIYRPNRSRITHDLLYEIYGKIFPNMNISKNRVFPRLISHFINEHPLYNIKKERHTSGISYTGLTAEDEASVKSNPKDNFSKGPSGTFDIFFHTICEKAAWSLTEYESLQKKNLLCIVMFDEENKIADINESIRCTMHKCAAYVVRERQILLNIFNKALRVQAVHENTVMAYRESKALTLDDDILKMALETKKMGLSLIRAIEKYKDVSTLPMIPGFFYFDTLELAKLSIWLSALGNGVIILNLPEDTEIYFLKYSDYSITTERLSPPLRRLYEASRTTPVFVNVD